MDLSTPEGRLAAAEKLGPDGYNRAMDAYIERSVIARVGGYTIRTVNSRFGPLYQVGTEKAFRSLDDAKEYAASLPTPSLSGETV